MPLKYNIDTTEMLINFERVVIVTERMISFDEYVCPNCYYPSTECVCKYAPWTLIFIDRNIQHAVRVLNMKGYQTISSCEGHYQNSLSVHVQLLYNYNFESMPDGFRFYERKNSIEHMMSRKNYKNESGFNIERANAIKALNQWVDALPVNPHLPKRITDVPTGTN